MYTDENTDVTRDRVRHHNHRAAPIWSSHIWCKIRRQLRKIKEVYSIGSRWMNVVPASHPDRACPRHADSGFQSPSAMYRTTAKDCNELPGDRAFLRSVESCILPLRPPIRLCDNYLPNPSHHRSEQALCPHLAKYVV
ncbi:uncharacterized protein METZ01_LOCUS265618 [marine metagenome]|uniref:Uncharacterized protein n=1 Tax=marine metagenome TaxID=408172 RepID=A0A382JK31_9ZZZZ